MGGRGGVAKGRRGRREGVVRSEEGVGGEGRQREGREPFEHFLESCVWR